eukprot:CFRG3885T1
MFKPKPHRGLRNQGSATNINENMPYSVSSHLFRICVLGARACGKTCLIERFVDGVFSDNMEPTIEDTYEVSLKMGNEFVNTHILDTAGEELNPGMYSSYIRKADGFVVCYKIQDHQSFTVACRMMQEIRRVRYNDVPLILVGNDFGASNSAVVVTPTEVSDQCNLHHIQQKFKMCSEKQTNVAAPFVLIVQLLLKNPPPKKRKDKVPGEE